MTDEPVLEPRPSYTVEVSPDLAALLGKADELKAQLDAFRPLPEKAGLWSSLQEKLRAEWTYHSNAIEGSSLSLGETIFFLREGLTVEGRPLKDFLDARNHAQAIDLLHEWIAEDRPLSEGLLKEVNALLLAGVTSTPAIDTFGRPVAKPATPGAYKQLPNTVLQADGTLHQYVDPLQVAGEMEYLCRWVGAHLATDHPVLTAALAHYNLVRIHPFDDGNGRGARILMNLILLKRRYPAAVIQREHRRRYIEALGQADDGQLAPFVAFIANALNTTQQMMLDSLRI